MDTARFDARLAEVQSPDHLGLLACPTCYETLQEAIPLYEGDFLADFYLDDSNDFEDWAEATRQRYRRKILDALDTLTTIAMRRSAFAEARSYAERQIAIDQLRESAHRQLMEILARSGQRGAALTRYDSYRRTLAQEMGMAPTAQTAHLVEQIEAGELAFDHPEVSGVRGYELKESIGEGAYGVIHRAVQTNIGREVAIKIIRRRYANDPAFIRRFESEARMVARLEHPRIVPLYDYWRDPQGAYLVMRYMRGGSLLSVLQAGPCEPGEAIQILEQVGEALASAHRQGIIHRDIKPANILLDESGNAYLSDFGIARDLGSQMERTPERTSPDNVSPEEIRNESVGPPSDIYSLGIVLYEMLAGQKPFDHAHSAQLIHRHLHDPIPVLADRRPALPPQVDDVIQRATAKRPAERYADILELVEAFRLALRGEDPSQAVPAAAPADIANPYKGLRPFGEADAEDFFGRRALVQQLLAHLANSPFLAVVGPSGSGKSSVVKAGLVPALRQGLLPGSDQWFVAEMVPGLRPLEELEKALWPVAVDPPPSLVEPMARDERGLVRTIRRILPDEERATLLLVIDQFEELFTQVEDRRRDHFLKALLSALEEPDNPLRVVITLRADFYDRPLEHQPLGRWMRENTQVILPLSPEGLTAAITEPAGRVGVTLEAGLVPAIVADVQDEPGALPLLQYALTELFDRREGGRMTLAAYHDIGGVSGALGRRAESLYTGLDVDGRETARQLFLRLVTLGDGAEDTRRRVLRAELEALDVAQSRPEATGTSQSRIAEILDHFGRYRLLTFDRDPITRGPTVEVAHEALLQRWPRLRGWLEEAREDIRLQRLLANAAAEWRDSGREEGYLLRGARLDRFERWAAEGGMALTAEEHAYLNASLAARGARQAGAAARQARERDLEAKSRRRLRYLVGVLAAAVVVAAVLSLVAMNFARLARQETRLATSRELAAAAISNLDVDPERSVLLALRGLDFAYSAEAENALHNALLELHLLRTFTGHENGIESLAISPDGARYASVDLDGVIILWEAGTGEEQQRFSAGTEIVFGMLFSPDGRHLITASADQTARVWDSASGAELLRIEHGARLSDVAISPDGTRLATAGEDAVIRVWDASNGDQLLALEGHAAGVRAGSLHPGGAINVAFTPDGGRIVTSGTDGTVRTWDAEDGRPLRMFSAHTNEVYLALGPQGEHVLTAGFDGRVQVWDISPGSQTPALVWADNQVQPARDASYSPDGRLVAVAGQDGAIRIWDAASGRPLLTLAGHAGQVDDAAFSPDSRRLVTVAADRTLRVWDLDPGGERLTIEDGQPGNVVYSPDGKHLATSHPDGTIAIRDRATGEIVLRLPGHPAHPPGAPLYLSFSRDGQRLASASWDRTAKVRDVATGAELLTLNGHTGFVWQAAFSPDGGRVVTASADGTARIWDAATGEELVVLSGHTNPEGVVDVAYSPDGHRIATSGCDARIWDAASGEERMMVAGEECFWGLDFSPDGRWLATGGAGGSVTVWDSSGAELGSYTACRAIRRWSHAWRSAPPVTVWPRPASMAARNCGICGRARSGSLSRATTQ